MIGPVDHGMFISCDRSTGRASLRRCSSPVSKRRGLTRDETAFVGHRSSVCYALERNARARPDDIFAAFEGGERWTFAQILQQVASLAGNLHELGVRQGDHVVLVLPTSPLALRVISARSMCLSIRP
jgi:non-ribosomal peptide synthetase component F